MKPSRSVRGYSASSSFIDRPSVENKRPDLSDIALFVEVAKRLSFSRAADALGIPNSSLSRRISMLERAVGVTLLHRSSRRVELTELGRKYFERCEKIVATLRPPMINWSGTVLRRRAGSACRSRWISG